MQDDNRGGCNSGSCGCDEGPRGGCGRNEGCGCGPFGGLFGGNNCGCGDSGILFFIIIIYKQRMLWLQIKHKKDARL